MHRCQVDFSQRYKFVEKYMGYARAFDSNFVLKMAEREIVLFQRTYEIRIQTSCHDFEWNSPYYKYA